MQADGFSQRCTVATVVCHSLTASAGCVHSHLQVLDLSRTVMKKLSDVQWYLGQECCELCTCDLLFGECCTVHDWASWRLQMQVRDVESSV